MLRTAPYFTTAPAYGLLNQWFEGSLKSHIEQGERIASAVAYLSNSLNANNPGAATGAGFLSLLESIARNPPTFTVYRVTGPGGAGFNVVSPNAPLFNFLA